MCPHLLSMILGISGEIINHPLDLCPVMQLWDWGIVKFEKLIDQDIVLKSFLKYYVHITA